MNHGFSTADENRTPHEFSTLTGYFHARLEGTKPHQVSNYTFVLLRVFVPAFSARLLVMRRAWSTLRNVPKHTGRVDYVSDP